MLQLTFEHVGASSNSKAEIGRSVASIDQSKTTLQQLREIQSEYNKNNQPKARVVQGKIHIISFDNTIEVSVLNLKSREFEINNQRIQFSKAAKQKPEEEIFKIKQLINKSQVLGAAEVKENTNQMAKAVYNLLLIASTY